MRYQVRPALPEPRQEKEDLSAAVPGQERLKQANLRPVASLAPPLAVRALAARADGDLDRAQDMGRAGCWRL